MAERERFELSRDVTPCTLSKGVVSATHPSLRSRRGKVSKLRTGCKTKFQIDKGAALEGSGLARLRLGAGSRKLSEC